MQSLQGVWCAVHDEDRSLPPTHHDLLSRLNLAEIDVDGPTLGQCRCVGVHLVEEWDQRRCRSERARLTASFDQVPMVWKYRWAQGLVHVNRRGDLAQKPEIERLVRCEAVAAEA